MRDHRAARVLFDGRENIGLQPLHGRAFTVRELPKQEKSG